MSLDDTKRMKGCESLPALLLFFLLLSLSSLMGCSLLGGSSSSSNATGTGTPVASNGTLTTARSTVGAGTLSCTNPNGTTLTYFIVTQGVLGVAAFTNTSTGSFAYIPNVNVAGTDTFTYAVSDGTYTSNTASVTVSIGTSPFSSSWPFTAGTDSNYTFDSTKIELVGGVASLKFSALSDTASLGFKPSDGGTTTGTTFDATNQYVRLASSGGCNATTTNCSALDSTWAPEWASLASYWNFDGTGLVSQIFNVTATLGTSLSANTATMQYVSGQMNQGISFNGSTDWLGGSGTVPSSITTLASSPFTILVWFKASTALPVTSAMMVAFQSSSPLIVPLGVDTTGKLMFCTALGVCVDGTRSVNDGLWHMAVAVNNGTVFTIYLDGADAAEVAVTYGAPAGASALGTILDVGALSGTSHFYTGSLDELAIWSRALTTTEIATIYSRQSAIYSGIYLSRALDLGNGAVSTGIWSSFAPTTTLPFFKRLPDGGGALNSETSTSYSALVGSTGATTDNNLMLNGAALWHLDESLGAVAFTDGSGNGNSGTKVGSLISGYVGKLGSAALFDGSSAAVSVPTSASLAITGDLTLSAWVKPLATSATVANSIVGKTLAAIAAPYDFYLQTTSGIPKFLRGNGAVSASVVGSTAPTLGVWSHVVVTMSGTTVTHYLNGQLNGTATTLTTTIADGGGPLFIGSRAAGGTRPFFNGLLDEVAIWSRALQPSEVLQLYRRGANRIKYQVRSCSLSNCSDLPALNFIGPDNTNQTYFSELNNQSGSTTLASSLSILFSNFTSVVPSNRAFQYRAIFESDDVNSLCTYSGTTASCSPELKAVTTGPSHYDASSPGISNATGAPYATLSTFIETIGGGGCTAGTAYTVSADGLVWYYWTGSAWTVSNGTTGQSNTATVVNTHLAAFSTQLGVGHFYFRAFLGSTSLLGCELENVTFTGSL